MDQGQLGCSQIENLFQIIEGEKLFHLSKASLG